MSEDPPPSSIFTTSIDTVTAVPSIATVSTAAVTIITRINIFLKLMRCEENSFSSSLYDTVVPPLICKKSL